MTKFEERLVNFVAMVHFFTWFLLCNNFFTLWKHLWKSYTIIILLLYYALWIGRRRFGGFLDWNGKDLNKFYCWSLFFIGCWWPSASGYAERGALDWKELATLQAKSARPDEGKDGRELKVQDVQVRIISSIRGGSRVYNYYWDLNSVLLMQFSRWLNAT